MKAKHEIAALAIMLVVCLLFAACAQKAEEKLTDKATDVNLISSTAANTAEGGEIETVSDSADTSEVSVADEMQSSADDEVMSGDEALKEMQIFYGSLFTVTEKSSKGTVHHYVVNYKNDKKYADVTVDVESGDITEKIADSGEVNTWNMFV